MADPQLGRQAPQQLADGVAGSPAAAGVWAARTDVGITHGGWLGLPRSRVVGFGAVPPGTTGFTSAR